MKAMILSAGFGTRLKPFTDELPKALVKYKGAPMINYQIERLKETGVNEIIINVHHHAGLMEKYFTENDFGIKINLIIEPEILGTGGGILNAAKYFAGEEYFLVINADIETDMDIDQLILFNKQKKPFATLAVQKRETKRYLGFDGDMKLLGRHDENSNSNSNSNLNKSNPFAFNGIHIISNRIFKKNPEVKYQDILEIYFDVIKDRSEFIAGFDAGSAFFKDLGKTENFLS